MAWRLPSHRPRDAVNLGQLCRRQPPVRCFHVGFELLGPCRARDHARDDGLRGEPAEREFQQRVAALFAKRREFFDARPVGIGHEHALIARIVGKARAGVERVALIFAGEQTTGKRIVRQQHRAVLAHGRYQLAFGVTHERTVFHFAGGQRPAAKLLRLL